MQTKEVGLWTPSTNSLDLDKYGTFVAYFRFVRQLASNDPDLKHWNGWALSKTSRAYPNKDGSYTVIGRPYKDGKVAKLDINGDTLYGHPSYDQIMGTMIRGKTNSVFYTQHQTISVTDKEKEVYAKEPQQYYQCILEEGEFRPGENDYHWTSTNNLSSQLNVCLDHQTK